MAPVRFEIWTRPDTGTFTRKFPLVDVVDYRIILGMFGNGKLVIPRDLTRLDDILFIDPADHANDVGTMIRAYVGETHLYDFYASRMQIEYGDLGKRVATITGGGYGSALERTRLRQHDWDTSPSEDPDWQYGLGANLVKNGGFETDPEGITNDNAEEGSTLGWGTTGTTGGGQPNVFEADTANPDVGSWHFHVEGDTDEGITQSFPTVDGETYTVSVRVDGVSGDDYRLRVTGAASATVGNFEGGAVHVDNTGTGAYQSNTVTYVADASGTSQIQIVGREATVVLDVDEIKVDGFSIGTPPWEEAGTNDVFESVTTPVRTGTHALEWHPNSGVSGNDRIFQRITVIPNQPLRVSMFVRHTEGSNENFRVVLRRIGVDPNTSNYGSIVTSVPTATYTECVAFGTPTEAQIEIELRYDQTGAPANNIHIDDVTVTQGMDSATVGEILSDIIDDAATDHSGDNRTALAWVSENYTDTQDADSVNWDADLSLRLKRGSTYRRIIEQLVRYGYEFDMRPDPADDTTIELSAYNPDGLGTDRTTGDGGAIIDGFIAVGPLIRREPAATYVMVEGDALEWADARNTTLETPWGEIEYYTGSKDNLITSLSVYAAEQLATIGLQELRFTVQAPTLTPGIDYGIGDIIRVIPGVIPTDTYRVVGITVKGADPEPLWQVSCEAI